jgi:KUP system potassium uptake protein
MASHSSSHLHKITLAGLLVTLGIIYGDIGTSPLYVMKAILGDKIVTEEIVLGAVSCVFWTLTLQTTIKYVLLTLQADNNGEGGIFALFSLVRRTRKWLIVAAIIGGATLLADGIITPAISVSSAIEGLRLVNEDIPTVPITIAIISVLFLFQRFGTSVVGTWFGPVMLIWFLMLAILGANQIVHVPEVVKAVNPYYAYQLLVKTPGGFWFLGAIFLCTTGAEALYSDLGHCGRPNIRISWIFVKICLLINYMGQAAWLLHERSGTVIKGVGADGLEFEFNPFFAVMPEWFLYPGIFIAAMATIIASQAMISGSFTLVSEAIRLGLFPKITVNYPSDVKGQIYIPLINNFLWIGCLGVVLFFRESSNMEAAYGLAITVTFLMSTILLLHYLWLHRVNLFLRILLAVIYFAVEGSFLVANLDKFPHGGYVTFIIACGWAFLMWVVLRAHRIKAKLADYVPIKEYTDQLRQLSIDAKENKICTHLAYMSTSRNDNEVERNVIYSILQNQPKRADYYWFVHIEITDEPYTSEYRVKVMEKDDVIRVKFRLGFRVQQKISLYMRKIAEEMVLKGEIKVNHPYHLINQDQIAGDFRYIILEEQLSYENELPLMHKFVLNAYTTIKSWTASPERWFGLDAGLVTTEKVPLVIAPVSDFKLTRIE